MKISNFYYIRKIESSNENPHQGRTYLMTEKENLKRWYVKQTQCLDAAVKEVMATELGRFLLGEKQPKAQLLYDDTDSIYHYYVASSEIKGYTPLGLLSTNRYLIYLKSRQLMPYCLYLLLICDNDANTYNSGLDEDNNLVSIDHDWTYKKYSEDIEASLKFTLEDLEALPEIKDFKAINFPFQTRFTCSHIRRTKSLDQLSSLAKPLVKIPISQYAKTPSQKKDKLEQRMCGAKFHPFGIKPQAFSFLKKAHHNLKLETLYLYVNIPEEIIRHVLEKAIPKHLFPVNLHKYIEKHQKNLIEKILSSLRLIKTLAWQVTGFKSYYQQHADNQKKIIQDKINIFKNTSHKNKYFSNFKYKFPAKYNYSSHIQFCFNDFSIFVNLSDWRQHDKPIIVFLGADSSLGKLTDKTKINIFSYISFKKKSDILVGTHRANNQMPGIKEALFWYNIVDSSTSIHEPSKLFHKIQLKRFHQYIKVCITKLSSYTKKWKRSKEQKELANNLLNFCFKVSKLVKADSPSLLIKIYFYLIVQKIKIQIPQAQSNHKKSCTVQLKGYRLTNSSYVKILKYLLDAALKVNNG